VRGCSPGPSSQTSPRERREGTPSSSLNGETRGRPRIAGDDAVKEWLIVATNYAVDVIDWMALIMIAVGAAEAFFQGLWTMLRAPDGHAQPDVWLRLGRWLVAGLTFQLAADILETAITTGWDEVARLAAIAAIRTFLNFFLERDIDNVRDRRAEPVAGTQGNDRLSS
jgi:uncharacterized membrane protein